MAANAPIRAMGVLVTLEKKGARFDIQINGTADFSIASYRMFIDCFHVEIFRTPAANGKSILSKELPVTGCPTTHLLLFSTDHVNAHFFLDGEEIAVAEMKGDATGTGITLDNHPKASAIFTVHKAWVQFAK